MGILGRIAESAAGAAVKRTAGGVIAGATGLFSVKMIAGMVVGVLLVFGFMWWKAAHDRDVANDRLDEIANVIAAANGTGTIERKQLVTEIQTIVTERATARRERDAFKGTAETQTREVRRLNEETARLREQSARQVRQVQTLVRQRDRWIADAQEKAERIERLPDPEEVRLMEEALDALYRDGF